MGYGIGFEIPHMISFFFFFVITFMFMSLPCTCTLFSTAHNIISDSSSVLNAATMEDNGAVKERLSVSKVSGNDARDEKHGFLLEHFRVLLGIYSFKRKNPKAQAPTRAPAPAPVPVLAPAPVVRNHVHSHHSPLSSGHPKLHQENHEKHSKHGNLTVILVATVVSSVTFVVCILVFIWFCRRIRKNPKRSAKTQSILKGSRRKNPVNKKVTFHPDMDLFYLNTLDFDLEREETCVSVELDSQSSDDDSFHSVCDSHSSFHDRLSDASASSLHEAVMDDYNLTPYELDDKSTRMESAANLPNFISPPRPPPPPPPFPSASSSTRSITKSSHSSKLPNLRSVMHSSTSSQSNKILRNNLPPYTSDASAVPAPPPPPWTKAKSNSITNHPPLPSQFTPLGKDGAPLPKLKPLYWDKVRAAPDSSMVWDKLRSSSFEFDEEMMESLFGYTLQKSMKNDEAKSKSPSPSKHVLDPKRLQNITILSKALNVTAEQVCAALVQGKGLRLHQLEALAKMVPTKEEEDKLLSYEGNINDLGSAEKFVKAMLDVPYAFLRIQVMLFQETFEDEVVHLKNSFSILEDACRELRSSRLFLKLLEAVLKTGNRMNIGTVRGGASAFKLDALLKLSDVKGTDGKTTLLHFVVQEMTRSEGMKESETIVGRMNQRRKTIEEREEDYRKIGLDLVSGLAHELSNVKKTATIDLDVLASNVSNLANGILNLRTLLQSLLQDRENSEEGFVSAMRSFGDYADEKLKQVRENERTVLTRVKEITEYFHGNVSKDETNPLRIFVIVRDFLGVLDHVCKEILTSKITNTFNPLASCRS